MPGDPHSAEDFRRTVISAALRECRMFHSVAAADLEEIAAGCAIRSLEKGRTLFREGEAAEGFYLVRSGSINVFRVTPDGREQIICVFHPGETFAEAAIAMGHAYPANAAALVKSQVIVIGRKPFLALIRRKPEIALGMLASMSVHLKHLVGMLQDLKGRQIEVRLADWLLRHHPGTPPDKPAVLTLQVAKKVLAGELGVTSETLSRTLARFRDEGLIRVKGPTIHLLRPEGLSTLARGEG